jgi:hypothetical protein
MSAFIKFATLTTAAFIFSHVAAHAQATRTWVSGTGSDANPCSRTAPCQTFAGAINKTAINGEINCLDPHGFGAVTIVKSITIDCHEVFASVLASFTSGIVINIAAGNPNDPLRSVRIRNVNINGTGSSGSVGTRTGLKGINIIAASSVFIEDAFILNFTQQGILDQRTTGGTLVINNTTVVNNAGPGIQIAPSSGSTRIDASLYNVRSENNTDGLRIGSAVRAMVRQSILSNNANGVQVDGPAANGRVDINNSTFSSNTNGILRGAGGIAVVSDSDFFSNTTAKTGGSGGLLSFGTNRLSQNGADGDAFTPVAQQ